VPNPAPRLTSLPPYPFVALNQTVRELQRAGRDVIRLDIGSPDMPPPDAVINALDRSVRRADRHGYAGYKGTADFREAVAGYYQRRFGVTLNPETEILPLIGSKEGIVNLALAYVGPGDLVLVPDIAYPSYSLGAHLAGGSSAYFHLDPASGYLPDFNTINPQDAKRAKLLWLNYPNNPTGAVANLSVYQQAVDYCREHDILLASDNPYSDVCFDDYVAPSALQIDGARDCTIEFMSFSKTFNMAGWRLGAAVGGAKAINNLLLVKSNMDSGHFHAIYDAGIVACDTPTEWIAERNHIYQNRRDRILAALPDIGLQAASPEGSLYIWAQALKWDGGTYCQRALEATGVVFAPGQIYGEAGKPFIRISIGMDDAHIDEAIDRLKMWYAKEA
jgi:LL-diaminopimelate aminotransferase